MSHDMIQSSEQLSIDDISSPTNVPFLYFSDADLLSEALQNSEVTSNCCYKDQNSSTTTTTTTNTTATSSANYNNTATDNLSVIFDSPDEIEDDISASIDFSQSPSFSIPQFLAQQDQIDHLSLVQSQNQLCETTADLVGPLSGPPFTHVFEEDCLSTVPSLNPSSPSCSFFGASTMANFMPALSVDSSGIFTGNFVMGSESQAQNLEFQGDNGGLFCPDSGQCIFNPGDIQTLRSENQQLMGGVVGSAPLASEMSSLEDSSRNKVGKLSAQQRKEKIQRYMKKRKERNFSKKSRFFLLIHYACRKTLADSRPRVRGRFAKNDDCGGTPRQPYSNHEEDDVVVKEKEEMVDSSDIFADISGKFEIMRSRGSHGRGSRGHRAESSLLGNIPNMYTNETIGTTTAETGS
ncbi:hypothetical protein CXB51_022186 [Gossypium anomalum]|uniref:CCT domain-containing protein n=1 Tax=Gossypium anomalum TaxID=47600 RepID=A0A8J5Z7L0_9ROSI|nr:hypothetical protein CXB51_022186 [Gossypium anomalum]